MVGVQLLEAPGVVLVWGVGLETPRAARFLQGEAEPDHQRPDPQEESHDTKKARNYLAFFVSTSRSFREGAYCCGGGIILKVPEV